MSHPSELAYDPEWTIARGLAAAPSLNPKPDAGCTFIGADGESHPMSFGALRDEAWRRGKHLLRLGLRKGDRLALIVPEPDDFVLTFLGAACVGVVPVPLYPPLGLGKLDGYLAASARVLDTAGCRMLLTSRKMQSVLWSLVDAVPALEKLHVCEKVFTGEPPDVEVEPVGPDDVAFIQFTSGSTAAPKGVVVNHRSLGANGYAIMRHGLEVDVTRDKALSWLPLYHDMGLIGFVIAPLTAGLEAAFMPTLSFIKRPSRWMQAMSDHRATITFAPNFAFGLAVKRTPREKVHALDLSRVRVLGAGAEPNHPGTLNAFLDHFAPAGLPATAMMPVYGMAEATLAMSFTPLNSEMRVDRIDGERYQATGEARPVDEGAGLDFVSCGWPFPKHELFAVDDAGQRLPDRRVGELVHRGPSVAAGYYQNPEATERVFRGDGLRTGDLGYTVEGEVFVTGRKKDLIILNGKNYDPQSVEWAAAEVQGIRKGNVIAFSCPGELTEQLVVACETRVEEARDELMNAVKRHVRTEVGVMPAEIVLCDAGTLPKTTSGKLQRARARALFVEGRLGREGDRTLGSKGQALTVARHVTRSAISRAKHTLRGITGR